ncbi:hypothetical protein [Pedobacter glucosidilyticus]|uniref:hypothetical protein n=1 Tax=Pedobacter glucosidilyticus TaxID=1122941 RepID=UPI000418310D|nr:hypothetical protein [Pedobacter glucosidilyticus]
MKCYRAGFDLSKKQFDFHVVTAKEQLDIAMSIILASIDLEGENIYVGTDKKAFNIKSGLPLKEEVTKLYEIRPRLFFAGNGVDDIIYRVKEILIESNDKSVEDLFTIINNIKVSTIEVNNKIIGDCVFVICGLLNDKPFIYVRDTKSGQSHLLKPKSGRIIYVLATFNDEVAKELHSYFPSQYNRLNDCSASILNTLRKGSTLCNTIGETFDIKTTKLSR